MWGEESKMREAAGREDRGKEIYACSETETERHKGRERERVNKRPRLFGLTLM